MSINLNHVGLDETKTKQLADKLNNLLADYSIFYMNVRGYHWNIRGDKFFELHLKFEELYTNLLTKIDEIAERVVTLGYTPKHSYAAYQKATTLKPVENISQGNKAIENILETFKEILIKQRELLDLSSQIGDEGTNSLMSDYIREEEKTIWMYRSYLG